MKTIKVAILTNIPSPYRVDLFNYLQNNVKEYEFHIIYSNSNVNNRIWNIDPLRFKNSTFLDSTVLPLKTSNDTRHIQFSNKVKLALNEINPEVVIACEYNPSSIQALMWCKKHKRKYINLTDGTLNSEKKIGLIQKLLRRYICKRADSFIASSSKAKEKLLYYGAVNSKIFVSLLTVDISQYDSYSSITDNNIILYVGSMVERKGLDLLLHALKKVEIDFQLHIVGNGTPIEKNAIIDIATDADILDRIKFSGFLEGHELKQAYADSSIFVLPTREDCYGLVILEAMCVGLPVIVSKFADGAFDLVENEQNGYVVDPYDSIAFSSALTKLLLDKNKRISMGQHSKKLSLKLSFSCVVSGYIKAIQSVC